MYLSICDDGGDVLSPWMGCLPLGRDVHVIDVYSVMSLRNGWMDTAEGCDGIPQPDTARAMLKQSSFASARCA